MSVSEVAAAQKPGERRGKSSPYYVSLDGLRAVAVLLVFFQHYGEARAWIFGWGWTGVDIFFVLSGFLITGILFDSQHKQHRFRDFYMRRTLRIFPLYYFVWLMILLLAPVVHWQWSWRLALWPAYLGNYANFLAWHVPYDDFPFDRIFAGPRVGHWFGTPVTLWLGHFWSLCLEEQFYLVWPLVVYRVRRREKLIRICLAMMVIMPLFRLLLTFVVPENDLRMQILYRSLPTRLDALLIGGMIALLLRGPERLWLGRWRRVLLFGTALVFVASYLVSTRWLHVVFYGAASKGMADVGFTLIDLFAAAVILECIHPGSWLGRVLSFRPLRALGMISYGFYVYHDLLHEFFAMFAFRYLPRLGFVGVMLSGLAGTTLIATASYQGLEKPMLRLKDRFTGQVHLAPVD